MDLANDVSRHIHGICFCDVGDKTWTLLSGYQMDGRGKGAHLAIPWGFKHTTLIGGCWKKHVRVE